MGKQGQKIKEPGLGEPELGPKKEVDIEILGGVPKKQQEEKKEEKTVSYRVEVNTDRLKRAYIFELPKGEYFKKGLKTPDQYYSELTTARIKADIYIEEGGTKRKATEEEKQELAGEITRLYNNNELNTASISVEKIKSEKR